MNILKRSITSTLSFSAHPSTKLRSLLYSTTYTLNPPKPPKKSQTPTPTTTTTTSSPSSLSNAGAVKFADLPRPSEIPYQAKVANAVNFIGHTRAPVKFWTAPDGKHWASTVIYQENIQERSCLIPIVFEGALAHIATLHVNENDCVYVNGRLSEEPLPFFPSEITFKLHLRVENINFVQGFEKQRSRKKIGGKASSECDSSVVASKEELKSDFTTEKGERESIVARVAEKYRTTTGSVGGKKGEDPAVDSGRDLVQNLTESIVAPVAEKYRTSTGSVGGKKGEDPVVDSWRDLVQNSTESIVAPVAEKSRTSTGSVGGKKGEDPVVDSWRDLVQNSTEWLDYRVQKSNGLVSHKYPDFKRKDTGTPLWLGSAPGWVLGGIGNLEFDVPPRGQKQVKDAKEDLWRSLVENPNDWWDNRLTKKNPKAPDFKHKTGGEVLWLSKYTPKWVLSKFPTAEEDQYQ